MTPVDLNKFLVTTAGSDDETTFFPIELDYLQTDAIFNKDLFVLSGDRYLLYRKADVPFTTEIKQRLIQSNQKVLYIKCKKERDYHKFFETSLPTIIQNKTISATKKATVLYHCATSVVQDVLENPRSGDNIKRSKELVHNTVEFLSTGTDAFVKMISLSSHDYYTYTHSVNVMTFGMGLASALNLTDKAKLFQIGAGGLLHDIGKSKIDIKILNKPGPLTDEEWVEMKKHPLNGYELVKKSPHISDASATIVLNHHEKLNGAGYPNGLRSSEIDVFSQLISICDVYDAMTTSRSYATAMPPYAAFQIIREKMKDHFKEEFIITFIKLLNLKDKL